jgi:hypothetical protein
MTRFLVVVFAALAFASAAQASGTPYRDSNGRFAVNVPDGWVTAKPTTEGLALIMGSTDAPQSGGICAIAFQAMPGTNSASQGELDQIFEKLLTSEFWSLSFKALGYNDVTVESSGSADNHGRKTFYVVATATFADPAGSPMKVKSKEVLHPIPGSLHGVTCVAKADIYAASEPLFEDVFASFVPKGADIVAQAPENGRSVLTLYSGPRFDGVARVVSNDTPNLPITGWTGTASFAVSGFGRWQVCDGLNYAGNCRLVSAPNAGAAMRISSVRRYLDQRDLGGAAGVVNQIVGQSTGAVARRMARPR